MLHASIKFALYNPSQTLLPRGCSSIFSCFKLKTQKLDILEREVSPLDLVKGGHRKRLISYSPTLIFSHLHDLGAFLLDLDLNRGEIKPDLELI